MHFCNNFGRPTGKVVNDGSHFGLLGNGFVPFPHWTDKNDFVSDLFLNLFRSMHNVMVVEIF